VGRQSEKKNGRGGKRKTSIKFLCTREKAVACVSRAVRQQNINPLRIFSSVGIPAALGWGECQKIIVTKEGSANALPSLFRY
jgi:hypothetical protein